MADVARVLSRATVPSVTTHTVTRIQLTSVDMLNNKQLMTSRLYLVECADSDKPVEPSPRNNNSHSANNPTKLHAQSIRFSLISLGNVLQNRITNNYKA